MSPTSRIDALLQPIRIRGVELPNRVVMSPLLISVGEGALLVSVDREAGPAYVEDDDGGE